MDISTSKNENEKDSLMLFFDVTVSIRVNNYCDRVVRVLQDWQSQVQVPLSPPGEFVLGGPLFNSLAALVHKPTGLLRHLG